MLTENSHKSLEISHVNGGDKNLPNLFLGLDVLLSCLELTQIRFRYFTPHNRVVWYLNKATNKLVFRHKLTAPSNPPTHYPLIPPLFVANRELCQNWTPYTA